jgi:isoaspartyl peptidase/L-asparaginase-like protein (Ntn-hydrolase superfamily)
MKAFPLVSLFLFAAVAQPASPVIAARRDGMLKELVEQHGDGGVIALDRQGHVATPFNTTGMMTGVVRGDGQIKISDLPAK